MNIVELAKLRKLFGGSSGGGSAEEEWFDDGNTHIWISLPEGRTSPMLGVSVDGTVTVDWGDGTTPDVLTGTSVYTAAYTPNHNYASAGEYVITLTVAGDMNLLGDNASPIASCLLRHSKSTDKRNRGYASAIKKIEIGNNVSYIRDYAFHQCYALTSIRNPVGTGWFVYSQCYGLKNVSISANQSSIGYGLLLSCYTLTNINIPKNITSISGNAFSDCFSLTKIRFERTTPPVVSSSDAFTGVPTDCIISVPIGCLDAYKSATNYPNPNTYTYVEE